MSKATRITEHSKTLIDVIQSTHPRTIATVEVIPAGLSDHDMIGCVRKLNHHKFPSKLIKCRNYSRYCPNDICSELSEPTQWNDVYNHSHPDRAWLSMKDILTNIMNKYAPFFTKRVKGKPCQWLSTGTKKEINTRDGLLRKARRTGSENDWSAYKRKRNQVNNRVKYDKRKYYRELLESNASEPRKFWKTIKEVFPINCLTKHTTSSLKTDEVETLNDLDTANIFCSFFSEIANNLKSAAFPLMNFVWKYQPKNYSNTVRRFNFKQVQVIEVFKNLKNLNRKKSIGLDDLPPGLFKDAASVITRPLTHIINLSLSTGIVPGDWKKGKIVPIYKSGSIKNVDNYRPITILPIASKILEKCVHSQVLNHLEDNKLLSDAQFGYRPHRSTELAATLFLDDIRKNMDKGQLTTVKLSIEIIKE